MGASLGASLGAPPGAPLGTSGGGSPGAAWRQLPEKTARLALRRLCALYLVVSGSAFLFPHRPAAWLPLLLLHAAGALLLLGVDPARLLAAGRDSPPGRAGGRASPTRRAGAFLADWYALLLMPLLYAELALLNRAVHGGRYFDGVVLGWERVLFGGEPFRELAAAFPALPLSEALHFFYLSYYPIILLPPLYLYLRGRVADHQRVVFALMLAFLAHYLFFVFLPVQGPRYLFPSPVGEPSQGAMYRLAHAVLEAGSSQGSAFPSSHVAVAFAQTALAFVFLRKGAPLLLLASGGLALGAVYAGFHYATDVVCGLALGLALAAAAPRVAGVLGGRRP